MQPLPQGPLGAPTPAAGRSASRPGRRDGPAGPPGRAPTAMHRIFATLRDAARRLFSPDSTSEQLMDVLHRIEGIRSAAELAERRWLESQLRQAQKLETIGQLAGGIAHDFNNILAVILANSELLSSALPDDRPDLRAGLDKVQEAARGGATMVRGLLGFSRRAELNFVTLDMRDVVAHLAQMVEPLLAENVEFKVAVPPDACPVRVDSGALQQILLNLVTNARDAMTGGGTLTIAVAPAPTRGSFPESVPWVDPEAYYCVAVSDTGVGMDQNTVERIFEPFFTTKPAGTGTGLGMAMVYGLTKQHGGFVHVYSEPGVGTTVKVYLPRSPEAAPGLEAQAAEPAGLAGGTETVLLVEDREELRTTTRRVLERLGYTVVEAGDGEAGLAAFGAHRAEIRLVVTDVLMPKGSGPELYRAIRAVEPQARFLFTSGYTEGDIEKRALLEPGARFIAKPWTIADLARQVRAALDEPPSP